MKHVHIVCLNYKRQWVFGSRESASEALFRYFHRHGLRMEGNELKKDPTFGEVTLEQVREKICLGEFLFITSSECVQEIYVETVPFNPDIEFPYEMEHPL